MKMKHYEELDRLIIEAIEKRSSPVWGRRVCEEAERIAKSTGRDAFRVIDGRIQALRRAGKIRYTTRAANKAQAGWNVV